MRKGHTLNVDVGVAHEQRDLVVAGLVLDLHRDARLGVEQLPVRPRDLLEVLRGVTSNDKVRSDVSSLQLVCGQSHAGNVHNAADGSYKAVVACGHGGV